MNYLKNRKNAFVYAFSGLGAAMKKEPHMRIHVLAALVALFTAAWLRVPASSWLAIAGCITLVMITELVNTAIEKICDLVMPEKHETIKYIKDISSAAVLLACIFSLVAAALVLGIPLYRQFF